MLRPKKSRFIMIFIILSFSLFVYIPSALVETHLQYKDRGNRHEGIKPKPVYGADIELISLLVDYKENIKKTPDQFKLRFFLAKPSEVYLTVRELDYKYYYWMDKVQPAKPWQQGCSNIFIWPTQDVIQQIDQLKMYDLGVVARLEAQEARIVERIAAVIFYHMQLPTIVEGYMFTFKTNGDARLTWAVYREGDAEPMRTESLPRQRGGRPFTIRWNSTQVKEGADRLVIDGYFLETNDRINQIVHFYHRPDIEC